jgi:hypothetical protein
MSAPDEDPKTPTPAADAWTPYDACLDPLTEAEKVVAFIQAMFAAGLFAIVLFLIGVAQTPDSLIPGVFALSALIFVYSAMKFYAVFATRDCQDRVSFLKKRSMGYTVYEANEAVEKERRFRQQLQQQANLHALGQLREDMRHRERLRSPSPW